MTEGGLGEGAKGGGLFSRLPSCLRRDRNEMRYQSLTVSEGENGDHLSSGWNAVLMPLLWRFKSQRTKLSKHAILQMELQAMGAGKHEQDKTLIHPSSQFSQIWKVIMAITVVCSVIEVPFIACFTPLDDDGIINRPDEYFHIGYRIVVDSIFVADIFVNFRTGYHKLGAVVMNKELIEHHYLRHGFVLDLIAALPILVLPVTIIFSIMCSHGACPNAWAMYLLRYVRLLQLAKVKSAMTQVNLMLEVLSDQTNTMATRLVQLLLWFIVLTHWFTCIWFLAQVHPINFQVHGEEEEYKLDLKDSWLANASPDDPAIPFCVQSFMDGAASFRETMILYINCFYWASSANDAYTTQNTSEKFIAILAQIVVENGFMALILASIISSLEEHSRSQKKHTIYRSKIDAVNDFMREEKFPPSVVDDVRHYYKYVWLPQQIDFTETNLHEELPSYLRTEVMSIITRKVLLTSDFMTKYFANNTGADGKPAGGGLDTSSKTAWISQISEMLIPKFLIAQQYLMRQGDIGTELYIIKQGKVAIEIDKDDGTKLVVAESGPGSIIGDIALLGLNTTRTASIRTITNCIIFELKQRDMEKVWEKSPTLKMYMLAVAKEHLGRRKSSKKKEEPPPAPAEDEQGEGKGEEGAPVNFPSTSSTSSKAGSKWMSKTKSRKSSGGEK